MKKLVWLLLLIPLLMGAGLKDTRVNGKLYVGSTLTNAQINDNDLTLDNNLNFGLTGARLSAASGVVTIAGIGNTNNENLTYDFETTSNIVYLNSGSGVTKLDSYLSIQFADLATLAFGNIPSGGLSDAYFIWQTTGNDSLQLGLICGSATDSGYFSIMEKADIGNANRSPTGTSVNPTLRLYSPDEAQATDYGELYHDQTDFNITSGSGALNLNATNVVIGNGTTTAGVLQINEDTSDGTNNATFTVPALAADTDYVLPADDGGAGEVLSTNGSGVLDWIAAAGGGDALVAQPLSQFAATTSAQLAGVLSDESGTDKVAFTTSPVFTTPNIGSATGSVSGNAGTVTNGVYTTGNQSIAGIKTFSDATEASNATTGGTVVSGGLAVAKRVYATDMTVTNKITGSISGNADGSSASCTGNAGTVTNGVYTTGAGTVYYAPTGTDVAVADGGTGKSSWTQYLIPYADTTTSFSQIAIGTSGQLLKSNGAGAAPAFASVSSSSPFTITDATAHGEIRLYESGATPNYMALKVGAMTADATWTILQGAALTTQLTTLTYTAPGTPDYAVQNLSLTGYGFVTADEGNTVLSVIKNLQDRVQELENRLEANGIVAAN